MASTQGANGSVPGTASAIDGMPYAVKDNIDVAGVPGVPTTGACPALTEPAVRNARVIDLLSAAGAVPIAKTNMDQFATGLVGTRSATGR
jgi:allophanate hydrolase